jgi:hypothetical protein
VARVEVEFGCQEYAGGGGVNGSVLFDVQALWAFDHCAMMLELGDLAVEVR